MRIVHIVDYIQPQLGYQEYFLPLAQVALGHNVHVITSDRYSPFPAYEEYAQDLLGPRFLASGSYEEDGIHIHRLQSCCEYSSRVWITGLEAKLRDLSPVMVIAHGMANYSAVRIALLKRRLSPQHKFKLIYDSHMVYGAGQNPLRKVIRPAFKLMGSILNRQADAFVGVAEGAVTYMHKVYGIPKSRISLIPLGVSTERFYFDPDTRSEMRKQLGFQEQDVVFIYAGKLNDIKGPHVLAEAALEVMPYHEHVRVLFVGGGDQAYLRSMQDKIEKAGYSERFSWQPTVANQALRRYYCAADVGVWPRKSSLTMLEAQACRLPIIVSDFKIAAERICAENGLIFKSEDVQDLAHQMTRLVNDASQRINMGQNGLNYVQSNLSYTLQAHQFIDLAYKGTV